MIFQRLSHDSFAAPLSKPSAQKNLNLEAFVSSVYFPHIRFRKRSFRVDERIVRQYLLPSFGEKELFSLSRPEIETWLQNLSQRLSPASCNRILSVLKAIYALAITQKGFSYGKSPVSGVAFFKIQKEKERYLSKEEAKRLMQLLEKSTRLEAFALRLLLLTGARKSEVLCAKKENLRVDLRILMVPLSKSGKARAIYLSDEAIRVIQSIPQKKENPWLFPGRTTGKPLSDIYLFWNDLRNKLGLKDVRIHDLRHSFASFLVNAGHSLYEVQKLLGHSNPHTTMRYAHLAPHSLINATQTLGNMFSAPTKEKQG